MPCVAVALVLASASAARADPAADDQPTAFACTIEKLARGERCTFEGMFEAASGSQGADNSKVAAGAARGCAAQDETVRKECESGVAEASLSPKCTLAGKSRLADDKGFLTPAAAACGSALRAVFERTVRMSRVSSACCKCLARSSCGVQPAQCNRELSELSPGTALTACLSRMCTDACAFVAPAPADTPPPPVPARGRAPHTI